MAAVKSQAGPGAMQSATGRKNYGLVRHCVQEKADAQKHRQNSVLRSSVGFGEAWPAKLEQTNTVLSLQSSSVHLPYRSPESVEMDEIMAAMVLTSLSCSPVIQSPTQRDPLPHGPLDMECGGGELSDSGSSGYWSWEHAPSPSVTETDSSMGQLGDEGLHPEPGARDELESRWCKVSSRGAYRCLWPSCRKVLTSRVGMKRHIRILHLGGAEQSHREEDFYYTEVSSEEEEPTSPSLSFISGPWSSCSSTPSQPTSREALPSSSAFSQSAPSSVWQIHTEHLYQACAPIEMTKSPDSPPSCEWTSARLQLRPQISMSRSRSVSVGEQWPQRNNVPTRSHTISASPSRGHCAIRKGRGEAKKCRKVYGVERRDQWCTACRWKKACQRFPD
ncbi:hypothetical protein QTP70_022534 [Hemibagrus guttatus]|uniref:C2H2-type domain-containing protein n=1 Tax=Hemibagrus guttatus TaxID=175788 RepID=A0AAE0UR11_9TELE|nr:hypothetical protein QTP70_022534 [Hemibagrus guttatus]